MTRESALEARCRLHTESSGGRLIKLTLPTGVPDRLLLTGNGKTGFVEFKSPAGRLRPRQVLWQIWLLEHDHRYLLCKDFDSFKIFLDKVESDV